MAYPDPCEKCGAVHKTPKDGKEACPAHIAVGPEKGRACQHEAGWGTGYVGTPGMLCRKHGGSMERNKRTAAAYALDLEITKLLNVEGNTTPVEDPFSALASIAGEILYVKDALREKVEQLTSLEDVGNDKYATQLHVLMQAYERFLAHSERVAHNMSKLDLESRIARMRAAIDGATAAMVSEAMAGALGTVELTSSQREKVMQEFGARLRTPALPSPVPA